MAYVSFESLPVYLELQLLDVAAEYLYLEVLHEEEVFGELQVVQLNQTYSGERRAKRKALERV